MRKDVRYPVARYVAVIGAANVSLLPFNISNRYLRSCQVVPRRGYNVWQWGIVTRRFIVIYRPFGDLTCNLFIDYFFVGKRVEKDFILSAKHGFRKDRRSLDRFSFFIFLSSSSSSSSFLPSLLLFLFFQISFFPLFLVMTYELSKSPCLRYPLLVPRTSLAASIDFACVFSV